MTGVCTTKGPTTGQIFTEAISPGNVNLQLVLVEVKRHHISHSATLNKPRKQRLLSVRDITKEVKVTRLKIGWQ